MMVIFGLLTVFFSQEKKGKCFFFMLAEQRKKNNMNYNALSVQKKEDKIDLYRGITSLKIVSSSTTYEHSITNNTTTTIT